MSSDTASILKKIKRLTSGGRSLNAIHLNKNLNQIEKHLMLVLAGLLDFRGLDEECSFGDAVLTIPVNQIAIRMSIKRNCVVSNINKLSKKGYVTKKQNFSPDDKRQIESTYMLTDQIFVEFAEELGIKLEPMSSCGGYLKDTGGVSERYHYLPNSLPNSIPEEKDIKSGVPNFISKKIDYQIGISNVGIADENSNSSVQGSLPLIEVIEDIKPEPKNRKAKASKTGKATVADTKQKMIAMFRPKPSLKSFVTDKDIHFMTSQVLEKYGDHGHAIIDYLYKNQIKYKKCGELPWIVNEAWRLIDTSKVLIDEEKENTHD
jgi:DNA-binding MarR family transcriptional regulator